VYAGHATPDADETAPLLSSLDEGEPATVAVYGEAKVACEQAALSAMGAEHVHICRAGLIAGPGDRSDRFGYWPARFARPGDQPVLIPEAPGCATQTIDVRDLAAWIVDAAQGQVAGAFNAVGATVALTEIIELARDVAGHTGPILTAPSAWLAEHGVQPWAGPDSFPLWLPGDGYDGFARRSARSAVDAGLRRRPITETMQAALADEREAGLDRPRRAGLSAETEGALVRLLRGP
jgi:nucleoside-diphosphate-sugar epimerase